MTRPPLELTNNTPLEGPTPSDVTTATTVQDPTNNAILAYREPVPKMKFIIEHMEEGLSDWVKVEYAHMVTTVGKGNLILSGMTPQTIQEAQAFDGAVATSDTVLQVCAQSTRLHAPLTNAEGICRVNS
ncbi:hypothetical protein HK101_001537 [Irineochytrium annulatum]|nr:hypothetical protein HK101_001537 [Irineochytrium annulatum]